MTGKLCGINRQALSRAAKHKSIGLGLVPISSRSRILPATDIGSWNLSSSCGIHAEYANTRGYLASGR